MPTITVTRRTVEDAVRARDALAALDGIVSITALGAWECQDGDLAFGPFRVTMGPRGGLSAVLHGSTQRGLRPYHNSRLAVVATFGSDADVSVE